MLCTTEGENYAALRPPANSQPGDLVTIGDFPRLPEKELNPKKSPWEALKTAVYTNEDFEATYEGKSLWMTHNGVIKSSLSKAPIS